MDNSVIMEAIVKETAAKVINNLDEKTKKKVLTEAIAKMLNDLKVGWEVSDILKEETRRLAIEYVGSKDVQERLRQKVVRAAEVVISGLEASIAKDLENTLKNRYSDWVEMGVKKLKGEKKNEE